MASYTSKKRIFKLSNVNSIPTESNGIYAFWYERWCLYLGKAKEQGIRDRLIQHWKGSHNEILCTWLEAKAGIIEFCYITVSRNEIDDLEKRMIYFLQPRANKDGREI